MSQITLYLDEDTARQVKAAARSSGQSMSRWVADAIHARIGGEWPASIERLAGAWGEGPEAAEIRQGQGEDIPREPF